MSAIRKKCGLVIILRASLPTGSGVSLRVTRADRRTLTLRLVEGVTANLTPTAIAGTTSTMTSGIIMSMAIRTFRTRRLNGMGSPKFLLV